MSDNSYLINNLVSIIFIATILANVLHQLFFTVENVPLPERNDWNGLNLKWSFSVAIYRKRKFTTRKFCHTDFYSSCQPDRPNNQNTVTGIFQFLFCNPTPSLPSNHHHHCTSLSFHCTSFCRNLKCLKTDVKTQK